MSTTARRHTRTQPLVADRMLAERARSRPWWLSKTSQVLRLVQSHDLVAVVGVVAEEGGDTA
jgi:hypothetical protein